MSFTQSTFELGCQHQSVANQQSPKSVDSVHKNGAPDPFFLRPHIKRKNGLAMRG